MWSLLCLAIASAANMKMLIENRWERRQEWTNPKAPAKIYGVNLGGWLLLEPWITPSLFEQFPDPGAPVDEYTFCQKLGKEEASRQLTEHWDTFYSFDDLQALRDAGINTLRIPVGYWILGNIAPDEPWVTGQMPYLNRLIGWAKSLGIWVVIDLHGAPGSQNGFDNSGRMGAVHWPDQIGGKYPNVNRTLDIIEGLARVFNTNDPQYDNVLGLEMLNEPRWDVDLGLIKQFYYDAYGRYRTYGNGDFHIHDAFRLTVWDGYMPPPNWQDVYLDTHIYHCFTCDLLNQNPTQHNQIACSDGANNIRPRTLWTVVGEWSLAQTDCADYLNGFVRPSQSRWAGQIQGCTKRSCAGVNDYTQFTAEDRAILRNFAYYQKDAYAASRGWFFWTAKTEKNRAPQWDYILGWKQGWIPHTSDMTVVCPQQWRQPSNVTAIGQHR